MKHSNEADLLSTFLIMYLPTSLSGISAQQKDRFKNGYPIYIEFPSPMTISKRDSHKNMLKFCDKISNSLSNFLITPFIFLLTLVLLIFNTIVDKHRDRKICRYDKKMNMDKITITNKQILYTRDVSLKDLIKLKLEDKLKLLGIE